MQIFIGDFFRADIGEIAVNRMDIVLELKLSLIHK
jgi:hypothetical protein